MRSARRGLIGLAVAGLVAGACGGGSRPAAGGAPSSATTLPATTAPPATAPAATGPAGTLPAATTSPPATTRPSPAGAGSATTATSCVPVGQWSTARLAAETVIVPVAETAVGSVAEEVAAGAGGVILFGTTAPPDLGAQVAAVEKMVPGHLGLLVMTDEEGGGVQRMANLVGNLPWPADMGANWNLAEITSQVGAVARKMAAAGVDMDLAPVVDVDGRAVAPGPTNPDGWRAFSGNPTQVSLEAGAYLQGLSQGGVLGVLKHFPGLGGASANTDDAPATTQPWPDLQRSGLAPFVAGIRDGVPAVMVANATVPGLTSAPASLSPAVISGELVGALHFKGLVLTDSLSAKAIAAAGYSIPSATVQALRAGADMVMYDLAGDPAATNQTFQQTVAAVSAATGDGSLPRSRLVAAATAALAARHVAVCP